MLDGADGAGPLPEPVHAAFVPFLVARVPARAGRLGGQDLQSITKPDVEALTSWMLTSGRRRGGKAGTGLSARSVRLTLGRLTAALEMAVAEGKIHPEPGSVRQAAAAHATRA